MRISTAILTGLGAGLLTAFLADQADAADANISAYCGAIGELAHNVALDRDEGRPAEQLINVVLQEAAKSGVSSTAPVTLDFLAVIDNAYVQPHLPPSVEQAAAFEQCLVDQGAI